ncbi:helix-turn-helix domain-containing protein [Phascolarctobacterium faecium]
MNGMMQMMKRKSSIVNSRLRQARIVNGKTAKAIADEVGISAQALSQYELGKTVPSEDIFKKLVDLYGLPSNFYLKEDQSSIEEKTVFFRSFSSTTKFRREMAFVEAKWFVHNIVETIEKKIKLPAVDPLFIKIKESTNRDLERLDVESLSKIIRRDWNLRYAPIDDLMFELEQRGVIVAKLDLADDIDGFSFWSNDRPYIFVNKNNNFFRLRMSMAHELCHLFFHGAIEDIPKNLKRVEDEAKSFAGAFLMPENKFIDYIITTNLNELALLKSKLKVSLAAIVKRCEQLGLISEERSISLNKQISKNKWRKIEPYDDLYKPENPRLMRQAITLLVEKGIYSKSQLIDLFALDTNFIEDVCCLEKNYLSGNKIIKFEIIK